jgi:uncharacterized protein involved in exopolysaccharide biosynthesis
MIGKVMEAFFRHAVLIVLPLILLPLVAAAAVLATPPQYEAEAGIWAERATYLNYSDDVNRFVSPALNQRNRLVELMRTRSFVDGIVDRTKLASLASTAAGARQLDDVFARDFDVIVNGDHLLVIRFRSEDKALAPQVLGAIYSAFKERVTTDQLGQAQLAITFYQGQLTSAESQLATARQELAKYLIANPSVAATVARSGPDGALGDVQFADLQHRVQAGQQATDQASASLASARLDITAGAQGKELALRLVDPVVVSDSASRQLKKSLIYPILAVALGFLISAGLLMMFTFNDGSVRSLADLAPDAVILGTLPRLQPANVVQRRGAGVTRRGIGFVAGTVVRLRQRPERSAS